MANDTKKLLTNYIAQKFYPSIYLPYFCNKKTTKSSIQLKIMQIYTARNYRVIFLVYKPANQKT